MEEFSFNLQTLWFIDSSKYYFYLFFIIVPEVIQPAKKLDSKLVVRKETQRLVSDVFATHKQEFPSIVNSSNVLFHLKEAVTSSMNPIVITLLNSSSQTSTNYSSQYITFNPGKEIREFQINNLFIFNLSLIHIWRCRRYSLCRSRWSPYH